MVQQLLENKLIETHKTGSIIGIVVGALICSAGLALIVLGLTGSIEWIVKVGSFSSRLANASPGAFFALIGSGIIIAYKPRISYHYHYNYKTAPSSGGGGYNFSGGGGGSASSPISSR